MGVSPPDDLAQAALERLLPDRPLRSYPAMLSTHADALAWARAGAPAGAVVVADYQASPRGRAGTEWRVEPGADLGFSLVVRPDLPPQREGWLYLAATTGLADVLDRHARIAWPDTVERAAGGSAALGVETDPVALGWAVVTVLVPGAGQGRGALLGQLVEAVEARLAEPADTVLEQYRSRCVTLGRRVRARLIPLGPGGEEIIGTAEDCAADGALLVRTAAGARMGIRPQHLGILDDLTGGDPERPDDAQPPRA